jgi:hypothetical protein
MSDGKRREQYGSPEIVRVGDVRELTLGGNDWVADVPGMPEAGYFDASKEGMHKEPYNPPTEPKPAESESEGESGSDPEQPGS